LIVTEDHRHGHRERLRNRLLKTGRESLADYELLELLLTYSIPRKDTKAIAKNLLHRFGSFSAIFDQPVERLQEIKGIGSFTATFFMAIKEFMVRYLEQEIEYSETISSPKDISKFIQSHIGSNPRENLMILCLDDAKHLVYQECVIEGTVDQAPFYPREIMKTALIYNATALILVHNHPSGDPIPSENDHVITQKLEQIAGLFDIQLLDHIIVTPRNSFSLKTGALV